jgi:acetyltransferase-like isoleucine patch superfamily enzyme
MILEIDHRAVTHDHVYRLATGRPVLGIGALSYTGRLHIYDYLDTMPAAQEAGFIEIGRCCSVGYDVTMHVYGGHDYRNVSTSPLVGLVDYKEYYPAIPRETIRIGNDCWIGNGVCILSSVTIGDGAVIGAQAVVAKDVPPFSIVVGNPARVIKYRFPEEQIEALLEIAWWNWPLEKIRDNAALLLRNRIEEFIARHHGA